MKRQQPTSRFAARLAGRWGNEHFIALNFIWVGQTSLGFCWLSSENTGSGVKKIKLQWMMELYKASPYREKFFDSRLSKEMGVFEKLTGSALLRQQVIDGKSEKEIRKSWEPGLTEYKVMRKKYLLYP